MPKPLLQEMVRLVLPRTAKAFFTPAGIVQHLMALNQGLSGKHFPNTVISQLRHSPEPMAPIAHVPANSLEPKSRQSMQLVQVNPNSHRLLLRTD